MRWRLAGVSAGLTFVILLVFAAVVGRLAQERLESDFENELQTTASQLAASIQVDVTGLTIPDRLEQINLAPGEAVQIVDARGNRYLDGPDLPDPELQGVVDAGEYKVVSRQVISSTLSADPPWSASPIYLQYARDHDQLDATIGRLWLFLGVGVAGGAILATLAGLWIAQRAMRPIAALTATAREIATTRDPSLAMPKPQAEDEVAELARTLDSMLAELDAARGEAQQMVQLQREFVADASHELRTPLTSILANLELLQERLHQTRPAEEEAEMVDSALRSSRRMRRLVGDLLMLARADAGRTGERRECDLAGIATHAVDEVLPIATEHSLELDAPTPVPVTANADELHRLTVNLLDNAVRHTPPGTGIRATVERQGEEAVLEVADDGPGLPEGMRDQVFSRFVRGGDGPADLAAGSGTGLGLAIVRAVATSHGGHVEAGTAPAGGARFVVRLPVAAEADINSKLSANV